MVALKAKLAGAERRSESAVAPPATRAMLISQLTAWLRMSGWWHLPAIYQNGSGRSGAAEDSAD
jgi:hypothetical protein